MFDLLTKHVGWTVKNLQWGGVLSQHILPVKSCLLTLGPLSLQEIGVK